MRQKQTLQVLLNARCPADTNVTLMAGSKVSPFGNMLRGPVQA